MLPHTLPSTLITVSDYKKYFENIAYSHPDILHSEDSKKFYTRIQDITGGEITYPLLLLIPDMLTYPGQRDALTESHNFEIIVLKSLGDGDSTTQDEIIDQCKEISDKIISKIEYDSAPNGQQRLFHYFNFSDLTGASWDDPIIGDKLVGFGFKCSIGNSKRFDHDPTGWR